MRRSDVVIRKQVYRRNRERFSHIDRYRARTALEIYLAEIIGVGLVAKFNYYPDMLDKLRDELQDHRRELSQLKARAKRFGKLVKLLEKLGNRSALEFYPLWWVIGAEEAITHTLDPKAIPAYRLMHEAVVAYFGELGRRNPDWPKIFELACRVACFVNPDEWREAGVSASDHGVSEFNTRDYLEAILAKPEGSIN